MLSPGTWQSLKMSFLLKHAIHRVIAESIYNEIISNRGNYYYYIGRVIPWSDESQQETARDTGEYEYLVRSGIIGIKKIDVNNVSFVVERRDWTSGTVYDQYDSDYSTSYLSSRNYSSIENAAFYVLTTDFNVYKCLFNNNGAQSTSKPSGTDPIPQSYADGYIWKYLYTIPLSLRNKFLTSVYMPVQTQVTNKFYSNGLVDSIIIDNAGSGYSNNSNVTLTVNGTFKGGTGNSIANLIPVFNSQGQFIDIRIKNRGNNYASANISINDPSASGTGYYNTASIANLVPILYNTQVDRVVINDPGINYSANLVTTITFIGDGANAKLTPYINAAGQLEDVIIENRGSGYTYLDIEVVGPGTNANAYVNFSTGDLDTLQSTVELSAVNGSLEAFRVANVGTGYTSANITVTGDGTGFIGNVILDANTNTISYIDVIDPGKNYSHADVTITGNGSNANVTAIISPFGGHGKNAIRELFADTLMFYSTIDDEKNHGIRVNNDFRQFGIIKDPVKFGSNDNFTSINGSTCYLVTLNSVTNLARDTKLVVLGATSKEFEVIEISNNQVLLLDKDSYGLSTSVQLYESNTATTYSITSVDNSPDINKFSGDFLFVDNRTSVTFSNQQLVTLRTTIKL